MKKVIIGRDKIGFIRAGQKNKPKLLMLHGLFANSSYFKECIDILSKDFDILAPDFPGFGMSDKLKEDPHTLSTYRDVIMKLCDFTGFSKFHLLGASLGGMVGINFCSVYPEFVEKLVIQASPMDRSCINFNFMDKFFSKAAKYKKIVATAKKVKPRINQKALEMVLKVWRTDYLDYKRFITYCFRTMDLDATSEIWNDIAEASLYEDARKLDIPSLLIVGDRDETVVPIRVKQLAKNIKNSRFKMLDGLSHHMFLEDPKRVSTLVKSFLM